MASLSSADTAYVYERRIRRWLEWCSATNVDPALVISQDIDRYVAWYRATVSSSDTAEKGIRSALSNWYGWLKRNSSIEADPTARTSSCDVEDCDKPHYGKGYCKLHYRRNAKHGNPHIVGAKAKVEVKTCDHKSGDFEGCGYTGPAQDFWHERRICLKCRKKYDAVRHSNQIAAGVPKECASCGAVKPPSEYTRGYARCRTCVDEDKAETQEQRRQVGEPIACRGPCHRTLPPEKFDPGYVSCRDCVISRKRIAWDDRAGSGETRRCRECHNELPLHRFDLNTRICTQCVWKVNKAEWARMVAAGVQRECNACDVVKPLAEFYPVDVLCRLCRLADKLRERLDDPHGYRARKRAYYAANAERERARNRAFSRTPAGRAIQRRAYRKNRIKILARGRRWHAENRDHANATARAWKLRNPDRSKWHNNCRRARKLMAGGTHTESQWRAILKHHNMKCVYCGVRPGFHRDHVFPISRGGSDYAKNLLPSCKPCNSSKHDKLLADWRYRNGGAAELNRLMRARPGGRLP